MQLEARYFRAAVIYAVLGLLLGIHMSSSQDHSQMPTHAHLLLLGWVSLFLSGAFLKFYPQVQGKLAAAHWWIANLGIVLMVPGVGLIMAGREGPGVPLASGGAFVILIGMVIFAWLVFRGTKRS